MNSHTTYIASTYTGVTIDIAYTLLGTPSLTDSSQI